MQTDLQVKTPETEEEFTKYYQFRYNLLRKPWNQPVGSEKDDTEDKAFHRMILDKDGNVIAVGRAHMHTDKEAEIKYIAVDEKYRKLGLGSKVVGELERVAREKGAEEVMLVSREGAVEFYVRNGYKIIKDSYTLFGAIKHKEMRKTMLAV